VSAVDARGVGATAGTLLADPDTYLTGVPHAELARRRREAPVEWVQEVPLRRHSGGRSVLVRGSGYWAVTRHATVVAVSRAPEVFSSAAGGAFLADAASREDLERTRQLLVSMDAPEHAAVRRVVTAVFTPRAVRGISEAIVRHADALVSRAVAAEQFDVVRDLAAELPLLVLAELLGIPREDRSLLFGWSNNLVGFDDPEFGEGGVERFRRTVREAFAYALTVAGERRRRPGEDLVSHLLRARVGDRALSQAEFCHLWLLLVVAGNESTRHLVSGTLDLLADRPALAGRLSREDGLVPTAVDELLRWISPTMQFRRTAVRDTELDGRRIAAGDKVVLYYVSANRDETVFDRPDEIRLDRSPNPHLAFGSGPHYCLGAHLAREEARVLLEQLRPHLPRLRRAGPAVRLRSNFMNGIKSMPASFRP
jgi:cytochrome P450